MKEIKLTVDSFEAESGSDGITLNIYIDAEEVLSKFTVDEIFQNIREREKLYHLLKTDIDNCG